MNNTVKIELVKKYPEDIENFILSVDSDVEQIIYKNPHINRVLMGNCKPDFVRGDAVCTWKNEGHRFYNEFLI